jgi:hypothetical protein
VRVVLAVRPRLLRELLRDLLNRQPDMEVVAEPAGSLDLLARAGRADLVLTSGGEDGLPGPCTHLLAEYPGLAVLTLPAGSRAAVLYRGGHGAKEIDVRSPQILLEAIRTGAGRQAAKK